MNGNGGRYGTETLEGILAELEDIEWDESDESEERARRGRRLGRRPPPPTAPGTGLATPRPGTGTQYVTQTQLQSALAKVGAQIKTNSDAIKNVSDRVSTQADLLSKEVVARKKTTDQLERGLRQTREMSALLPLLSKPATVELDPSAAPGLPKPAKGPRVLAASDDTLSLLLPMMLLGGSGGSGSGGGGGLFGGGGGEDNSMMMMMMVLALSPRK